MPPSTQARLRLRVSDGFHVATAVSNQFTLTAHPPVAIIRFPHSGQAFTEGRTINLSGGSLTSDGKDTGTFEWLYNGIPFASGQNISYTLSLIGIHTLGLQVASHGLTATQSITVSVLPDYSHTGIPDSWLQQYKLNPLDPTAAYADPIGKGLTNLQNYQLGLNPLLDALRRSGACALAHLDDEWRARPLELDDERRRTVAQCLAHAWQRTHASDHGGHADRTGDRHVHQPDHIQRGWRNGQPARCRCHI